MIPKVMVVDSNVVELQSLRRELTGDYKVLCSSRGTRSVDLYRLFLPHAVVLNIAAEGLDVDSFIAGIRQAPGGNRVPIWVLNRPSNPAGSISPFTRSQSIFIEGMSRSGTVKSLLDWHFGIQRMSAGVVEL